MEPCSQESIQFLVWCNNLE